MAKLRQAVDDSNYRVGYVVRPDQVRSTGECHVCEKRYGANLSLVHKISEQN